VVAGGVIQVTYGNQANSSALKAGQNILGIFPYTNLNKDVVWICGGAAVPAAANLTIATGATANGGTTASAQYLPSACHS
jgi:hypothetical protein